MDTLDISDEIRIPMAEIEVTAIRSRGAGGQHVNKVATAIRLRFDSQSSDALPDEIRKRLLARRDHRITADGVIVIKSQAWRSQERNRKAALERLAELINSVVHEPKRRIPTRPGRKQKQKRLDDKRRRSDVKRSRGRVSVD